MRIIAGKAGRIAIKVPAAVARPTTDFVRQAVYSILGGTIDGAAVLDLFAGSGALGLEGLSRGAASCVFTDANRQACTVIAENLAKAKLTGGTIVKAEAATFLKRDAASYDLIFSDPPYWKHPGDPDHIRTLLDAGLITPRLKPGGWFIAEVSCHYRPPEDSGFTLADRREYGSSAVLFYQLPPAASAPM